MGFQKIRNLGGKLGNAVKETYEAETVGDLLCVPLSRFLFLFPFLEVLVPAGGAARAVVRRRTER